MRVSVVAVSSVVGVGLFSAAVAYATTGIPGLGTVRDTTVDRPREQTQDEVRDAHPELPDTADIIAPEQVSPVDLTDADSFPRHGPYRIVPDGYAGPLPYAERDIETDSGVVTSDLATVRESPLFVEPRDEPLGYTLTRGDSFDGTTANAIRLGYQGSMGETLEIVRAVRARDPIDVFARPPGDILEIRITTILDFPGVLLAPTDEAPEGLGLARVRFVAHGVETVVTGTSLEDVLAFASSLAHAIKEER